MIPKMFLSNPCYQKIWLRLDMLQFTHNIHHELLEIKRKYKQIYRTWTKTINPLFSKLNVFISANINVDTDVSVNDSW